MVNRRSSCTASRTIRRPRSPSSPSSAAADVTSSHPGFAVTRRAQPFRLTPRGKQLIEKAVPAWEAAQRQATDLLGDEGIAMLDEAARKVGMARTDR